MAEPEQPCIVARKKLRVSWSRMKNAAACPQRGHLLRQGKGSKVRDGRVFLEGTLSDLCMRLYLEEGKFEIGGMEKFLEDLWAKHTGPEAQYTIQWKGDPREDKNKAIDKVRRVNKFMEPLLIREVAPYRYKPEYRFTATLGVKDPLGVTQHVEILGAVDVCVQYDDDTFGLFDLKVSERDEYLRSTLGQLPFYGIAFRGWTGSWPSKYAFWAPLLPEPIISLDVTAQEIRDTQAAIVEYCTQVWNDEQALTNDTSECYNCPTKHACPRFVTPLTKDDQGRNRASFDRTPHVTLPSKEAHDA